MMAREGGRIAVIGAGFSGVMTAIHLLWRCRAGRAGLSGRDAAVEVGPGLAYGTAPPAPSGQRPRREHERVRRRARPFRALAGPARPGGAAPRPGERTMAGLFVRRVGVRQLRPGAAARGDRPPGRRATISIWSPTRRRRSARPGGPRAGDGERPDLRIDAAVLALGNFPPSARAPARLCRQSLVGPRLAPLEPGPAGGRARHRAHHGRRLPRADRAGVQGADPRDLAPRPAAAGPRAVHALGWLASSTREDRRSLLSLFRAVRREVRRAADGRRRLARGDRRGPAARADPVGGADAGRQGAASCAMCGPGGTSTATAWRRRSPRRSRRVARGGPAATPGGRIDSDRAGGGGAARALAPEAAAGPAADGAAGDRLPRPGTDYRGSAAR